MYNLTFEFILHLYSFFRCFLSFFIPVEGLCCRPKYWANTIHRFDDQNSLTSKCIENWDLFERLTHSQRSTLSACPRPPEGLPNAKPSKASSLFVQFKDAYISTFQRPDLERILVSRGEAQPFGEFTQLSGWVTLYDNSVYGNWLRQKGVAKVSGILEGSDFNIKSICERLRKGPKRND